MKIEWMLAFYGTACVFAGYCMANHWHVRCFMAGIAIIAVSQRIDLRLPKEVEAPPPTRTAS